MSIKYEDICEGSISEAKALIEEQTRRPYNYNEHKAESIKSDLTTVINSPVCRKFHEEAKRLKAQLEELFP